MQAFSFLCYGSALFHASATDTGGSLDVDTISILTYAMHQASIENLRELGASPVITDLSPTPRELSAVEMAASMSDMFLNEPPYEWTNHSKERYLCDVCKNFRYSHPPSLFVTVAITQLTCTILCFWGNPPSLPSPAADFLCESSQRASTHQATLSRSAPSARRPSASDLKISWWTP